MTTLRQINACIERNDLAGFERLLRAHPECRYYEDGSALWIDDAARKGLLPFIEVLVELGVDVNDPCSSIENDTAIVAAATEGHLEIVRWLLDHGAKLNFITYGQVRSSALIRAARLGHLEVVKLLVERGADVNATGGARTPLGFAIDYNQPTIAAYLRSVGATVEGKPLPLDFPSGHRTILDHFTRHRGKPSRLPLTADVAGDSPIAVYAIPPSPGWDGHAVFTLGMSDRHLTLSETGWWAFLELVIYLPPDWPLTAKSLTDPKTSWPVQWLRRIARATLKSGKWPGCRPGVDPLVFANGDPPEALGPDTKQSCVLCLPDPGDFGSIPLPDGRVVNVCSLYPIYTEERDLEKAEGTRALIELFEKHGINRTVNPTRKNVAKPRRQ